MTIVHIIELFRRLTPFAAGFGRWAAVLGVLSFAGCSPTLSKYEWHGEEEALRVMARRAQSIGDVSATCRVLLRDSNGESIQLDGALAARSHTHLRVRAWKFNQP